MGEKKEILVVEDHQSIRLVLSNCLGKTHRVVTCKDGLEALSWLSQGNLPDLIILDRHMPRISGLEFLTNIRTSGLFREIPVLILSGEENNDNIEELKRLGISGFVAKPFNPAKINESIEAILQRQTLRALAR